MTLLAFIVCIVAVVAFIVLMACFTRWLTMTVIETATSKATPR